MFYSMLCIPKFETSVCRADDHIGFSAMEPFPNACQNLPSQQHGFFLDAFLNIKEDKRFALEAQVNRLVNKPKYITAAPGDDDMSFLVASESSTSLYHHVNINLKTGQIACDVKKCLSHKTTKICHHTLAVAVQKRIISRFAQWHNKQKAEFDSDKMVSFNLAKGTGQKAHRRTQIRLGTNEKTPQVTTVATREGTVVTWKLLKISRGGSDYLILLLLRKSNSQLHTSEIFIYFHRRCVRLSKSSHIGK